MHCLWALFISEYTQAPVPLPRSSAEFGSLRKFQQLFEEKIGKKYRERESTKEREKGKERKEEEGGKEEERKTREGRREKVDWEEGIKEQEGREQRREGEKEEG